MAENTFHELSVAIPTFGKAKYLREAIDSILNQEKQVLISICDGGSIFDYSKIESDQLRTKRVIPDPGIVECWSTAAQNQTKYISFLADDNRWVKEFASEMTDFLNDNQEVDLVFCGQNVIDDSGVFRDDLTKSMNSYYGRDKIKNGLVSIEMYEELMFKNSIPLEAMVIKKSIWEKFGPFNTKTNGAFDVNFIYTLLLNKVKIGYIDKNLMDFRLHSQSYSSLRKKEHLTGALWMFNDLIKKHPNNFVLKKLHISYLKQGVKHEKNIAKKILLLLKIMQAILMKLIKHGQF